MREKEGKVDPKQPDNIKKDENPVSGSIQNAHAAGDGAMGRNDLEKDEKQETDKGPKTPDSVY